MTPDHEADGVTLYHGDCRAVLPTLPAASFDLVFTDPPYPEIDRPYGRLTEAQWFALMRTLVPEVRRLLRPRGSAVFVLQPNSERAGKLRPWLFEFQAWLCREWNVVQDAYWWNPTALPMGGANTQSMLRGSVKACVWCGPPDCYRDQGSVLLPESARMERHRNLAARECRPAVTYASGNEMSHSRCSDTVGRRGGRTTPFNILAVAPGGPEKKARGGHPAATPLALCDWWTRYLVPPGGAVLDPFAGNGTTGVAALRQGKTFVGVEKESAYIDIARKRLAEIHGPLFAPREETPA
jgi:DNA modification methylase